MRFVRGVGLRSLQLLEESGYRVVEDLAREDPDRLALRTGLGIKKAQQVQEGARDFVNHEASVINEARARLQEESDPPETEQPADEAVPEGAEQAPEETKKEA